jgi:Uma2 family endonuclease
VKRLNEMLGRLLAGRAIIAVQDPVRLSDLSEPQPDLAVLHPRDDFYSDSHPGPGDVHLIIEVTDTSGGYDRSVKAGLYARAGIPELWIVDVPGEVVSVFREPSLDGYSAVTDHREGDTVSPLAFPDARLRVDEIL